MRSKNGVWISETGAGWEIVRRGVFDYGDYLEDSPIEMKKLPKQLVINLILPLVNKASEIDIDVFAKHVRVKAGPHDFEIKLPHEVVTTSDLNAKWTMPNLSIELDVKPVTPERKTFKDSVVIDSESESDSEEVQVETETEQDTLFAQKKPPVSDGMVREAKYSISIEDRIATVVLFVPRSVEETLKISDDLITLEDKMGQKFEATIKSPFPLRSVPIVRSNPVTMTLVFIEQEKEDDPEPDANILEPLPQIDVPRELQNKYIFELE